LVQRLYRSFTGAFAARQQFDARPLGKCLHPKVGEHVVSDP
jgi:hypothetical protein